MMALVSTRVAALPLFRDLMARQTAPAKSTNQAGKGPLKVFILAGQSNVIQRSGYLLSLPALLAGKSAR
jgi:hypothetical protein